MGHSIFLHLFRTFKLFFVSMWFRLDIDYKPMTIEIASGKSKRRVILKKVRARRVITTVMRQRNKMSGLINMELHYLFQLIPSFLVQKVSNFKPNFLENFNLMIYRKPLRPVFFLVLI